MGVQRERVKRVGDLPAWFQLRKYDKLIDLNAAGWFEQLMVREKLVRILSAVGKASMPDEGFAEIHEFVGELAGCFFDDPVVDVMTNDVLSSYFYEYRLSELKMKRPRETFGVSLLSLKDYYFMERLVEPEKRDYLREWSRQFEKEDFGDMVKENRTLDCLDWFDSPIDMHVKSQAFGYTVRVNPLLPEHVLIEQFRAMLRALRGENFTPPPKPNFASWIKFGVLPYIDLWIWSCISGVDIPNRVMADAIFPAGEGGEEVVRKTTNKLAWELLSAPNLDTLAALGAAEVAEQNWV